MSIRLVKQAVILHGGILNVPITRHLINLVQNSTASYEQSQSMKKAAKTLSETVKKLAVEVIEKSTAVLVEIDAKIVEEQRKLDAANEVLKQGQKTLRDSLT